jgi:predicted component of type VI protein secretion system
MNPLTKAAAALVLVIFSVISGCTAMVRYSDAARNLELELNKAAALPDSR